MGFLSGRDNAVDLPVKELKGHFEEGSAKNQHLAALKAVKQAGLKLFPPYTLRHSALTRLAEAGCDPFTLARIAGHSTITITQRYCHPQREAVERAFRKLAPARPALASND